MVVGGGWFARSVDIVAGWKMKGERLELRRLDILWVLWVLWGTEWTEVMICGEFLSVWRRLTRLTHIFLLGLAHI